MSKQHECTCDILGVLLQMNKKLLTCSSMKRRKSSTFSRQTASRSAFLFDMLAIKCNGTVSEHPKKSRRLKIKLLW